MLCMKWKWFKLLRGIRVYSSPMLPWQCYLHFIREKKRFSHFEYKMKFSNCNSGHTAYHWRFYAWKHYLLVIFCSVQLCDFGHAIPQTYEQIVHFCLLYKLALLIWKHQQLKNNYRKKRECLAQFLHSLLWWLLLCWSPGVCSVVHFIFKTQINFKRSLDAVSFPQIGVQIGEIHNNGTGGGNLNGFSPNDDRSNSSSSVPGSGYP